ncbi:hypothetical protein [Methylobacterium sp. Leaf100]|uniref:hypothetical protein n=1 Tax=Methylobacterium sp. Leaf100 TaxID=1736252 RepID=UPI000700CD14|nr:hypothetical protein [Methylobacterium sp. Leaf100]KQP35084.1 hypothetical protein ASF25_14645 [Methylobacterium sp. Leaf100]
MTHSPNPAPKPGDEIHSLPDDIALRAGMPRGHLDEAPSHTGADDLRARAGDLRDAALETADHLTNRAAGIAGDVRDRVTDTAQDLRARASGAYDDARDWATDARDTGRRRIGDLTERGSERLRDGRSAVGDFVTENPLLVGVVGLAAGLLIGALLPRTRREDETVGPWADEVRDQGLRYARDVTHRGREFVASALDPENLQAAAQRATAPEGPAASGDIPAARPH